MSTEKKVLGWRVRSGHQEAATSTTSAYRWENGHRKGTLFKSREVAKMIVSDGFGGHRKLIRIVAKSKPVTPPAQPQKWAIRWRDRATNEISHLAENGRWTMVEEKVLVYTNERLARVTVACLPHKGADLRVVFWYK